MAFVFFNKQFISSLNFQYWPAILCLVNIHFNSIEYGPGPGGVSLFAVRSCLRGAVCHSQVQTTLWFEVKMAITRCLLT